MPGPYYCRYFCGSLERDEQGLQMEWNIDESILGCSQQRSLKAPRAPSAEEWQQAKNRREHEG
ncbi:hypothetical protein BM221_001073 [Beauveria bassiana]|uniref:Uncharacterized protein n=1 Tax=Beauveria bassiana TaxID=176275 RepID=A0A2N6P2C1_BEABA|nr:hypothetical protein BM221_001073 [Beauveria bassiana]